MALYHEDLGSKISAKIKIYILSRAESLYSLCNEIPCRAVTYQAAAAIAKGQLILKANFLVLI